MNVSKETPKLIASRGQRLCTALPCVYVLIHRESDKLCDYCLQCRGELLKCSACQIPRYCNKTCQKNGWKFHKEECKGNRRIAPFVAKDSTRLMLRLIIRSKLCNDPESSAEAFGQRRSLEDLMSHKESIRSDQSRCEEFLQLCLSLRAYAGDEFALPGSDELLELYGKMCINTFSICDPEMRPIGAGLYLGPSILDHSCQPNAVAVFDGRQLHINCIEPIYEGQKVLISYIDLLETSANRRDSLHRSYYFQCDCSSCLDRERDSLMKCSLCPNECCSGPLVENKDGNFLPCKSCGHLEVAECYRERKTEATTKAAEVLRKLKDLKSERRFIEHLQISEACIRDIEDVLHPLNIYHSRLLDAAFDGCIEVGNFEKALDYGMRVVDPLRSYLPTYHPDLGIHLMKVGKIQLFLEKATDAIESLKQAEEIIRTTHGSSHVLYTDLQQLMNECQRERMSSIHHSLTN